MRSNRLRIFFAFLPFLYVFVVQTFLWFHHSHIIEDTLSDNNNKPLIQFTSCVCFGLNFFCYGLEECFSIFIEKKRSDKTVENS